MDLKGFLKENNGFPEKQCDPAEREKCEKALRKNSGLVRIIRYRCGLYR